MIPKIIHWCWLSNDPIPESLQKCMDSWKVKLPDYDFIHWNFDRFPKGTSMWVDQAFDNKKYAFAADYIRLYALYNYGGIYLDMDVEMIKSFNPFLNNPIMLGLETSGYPEVAVFGAEKGCPWIKLCLDHYEGRPFIKADGSLDTAPLPTVVKKILSDNGYKFVNIENPEEFSFDSKEICLLPADYFSPKSHEDGKIYDTDRTVSIHRFAGTWMPWYDVAEGKIWHALGLQRRFWMRAIMNRLKK